MWFRAGMCWCLMLTGAEYKVDTFSSDYDDHVELGAHGA